MTAYDQLVQAWRDLIKQGRYGHDGVGCCYLTNEGNSCIVGLIARKTLDHGLLLSTNLVASEFLLQHELPGFESETAIKMATVAQGLHDRLAIEGAALTWEALIKNAEYLPSRYSNGEDGEDYRLAAELVKSSVLQAKEEDEFDDNLAKSWAALIKQRRFGMDEGGTCCYLSGDGASCIAGHYLKLTQPDLDLTNLAGSFAGLIYFAKNPNIHVAPQQVEVLQSAQWVHDNASEEAKLPTIELLLEVAGRGNYTYFDAEAGCFEQSYPGQEKPKAIMDRVIHTINMARRYVG